MKLDPQRCATMTMREREVLRLVARDRSNDEIAGILGISTNTVANHLKNARAKLDAPDKYSAARALAAFEGRDQMLASPSMAMPAPPIVEQEVETERRTDGRQPMGLQEERAFFLHEPPVMDQRTVRDVDRRHLTTLQSLTWAAALVALLAIIIVAGPGMGESFQMLANWIDPPTP